MTPIFEFIKFILPIERYPFRSIGQFAGAIVSVANVIGAVSFSVYANLKDATEADLNRPGFAGGRLV